MSYSDWLWLVFFFLKQKTADELRISDWSSDVCSSDLLGVPLGGELGDDFWYDELFVSTKDSEAALGELTGRHHLAFQAADRAAVDAFYQAGLAAGGRDNGAPGERPYHPGYYAAFLLDPDGNNIEAVYHGEHERSAPSVEVRF